MNGTLIFALASDKQLRPFEVGDQVAYWSDTHRLWMEAQVLTARADGKYDLDVKRGASAHRLKRRASLQDEVPGWWQWVGN